MAQLNDYGKSVAAVIKLLVANNAGSVARALKQVGAETKDFVPDSQLEADLWTLHATDRPKFYQVLNSITWNYGNNNWTNNAKYRDAIMKEVGAQTNSTISKSNFLQSIISALQGQSTQNSSTTTTGSNTQTIIIMAIITIAIFGLLFYVIKNLK